MVLKMYDLYLEYCEENGITETVKASKYRSVFGTEYNLSFYSPRKDQCETCFTFAQSSQAMKEMLEDDYQAHLHRKAVAQGKKKEDKDKALSGDCPGFMTATFDLQKVLQIPSSDVSPMYYVRKLCVYNLTFYIANDGQGYCYPWTQLDGQRGSTEIGSCLRLFLNNNIPDHITELSLFSDCCGGQNRNQFVAALLLHHPTLEIITHNFLEPGHTQMECDSMHSAIEGERKSKSVYTIHDWLKIMGDARRKNPYHIKLLSYKDFVDVKKMAALLVKNTKTLSDGTTMVWPETKSLRYIKGKPGIIGVKMDHEDKEYVDLKVWSGSGSGRVALPSLNPMYKSRLPITTAKKKDLLKLCRKNIIPEEFHGWYEKLPTSKNARDTVSDGESGEESEKDL